MFLFLSGSAAGGLRWAGLSCSAVALVGAMAMPLTALAQKSTPTAQQSSNSKINQSKSEKSSADIVAVAPKPASSDTSEEQAPLAEPSASARDLFFRNKDRLLQVRVLLASASEQSALGSGFVVQDDGAQGTWVVTNYHVVSGLAIDPHKYRIELRGTNERTVRAQVMAVDVIHDLAVLRIDPVPPLANGTPSNTTSPTTNLAAPAPWNTFALRETRLTQGSKVFSLGNPLELGFLISEGIYNGLVESRIYDQMLFSGAINSGMSGGPAIDEAGRVVGVNVATRRDGESLSFLVPVQYVRALLDVALTSKPRTEWRTEIARQLRAHQAFVVSKILPPASAPGVPPPTPPGSTNPAGDSAQAAAASAAPAGFATQTLSGRKVPTLDGRLTKCWANGADGEKLRFQQDSLDCQLHADLYVSHQLYTGSLSLRHVLLRNDKLATVQFLNMGARGSGTGIGGSGGEITRAECQGNYVQGALHPYRVTVCVRAYRKFEGLYDLNLSAVQMDDAHERLTSTLRLNGFSFDNAQRVAAQFLGLLQ